MLPAITPRRYERVGLRRGPLIAWHGPSRHTVSRVSTLGLGGLFIQDAQPADIGESIRMVFKVPDGEVHARAMVRDSHPGKGMGVEFISMKTEDRARLRRLMRRLLGVTPRR